MHSTKDSDYIPDKLYHQIMELLPIVSVEAVIMIGNSLLFLRRKNEPAIGEWWFAGGGIRKGESLKQALYREVKEETTLQISDYKLVNVYSRIFPNRHDITIVYLCKCKEGEIVLNDEHSKYTLFSVVPAGLHPYLLEVIEDCKLEKQLGL